MYFNGYSLCILEMVVYKLKDFQSDLPNTDAQLNLMRVGLLLKYTTSISKYTKIYYTWFCPEAFFFLSTFTLPPGHSLSSIFPPAIQSHDRTIPCDLSSQAHNLNNKLWILNTQRALTVDNLWKNQRPSLHIWEVLTWILERYFGAFYNKCFWWAQG